MKKKIANGLIVVSMVAVLAAGGQRKVFAAETADVAPDREETLISIEFPVLPEDDKSPFDFILDPQGLINATHAVRYGGRTFEEGATLYFENEDGAYDFSDTSDFLTITSRSTVPVRVKVTAYLENREEMELSQEASFADAKEYLYLALIDDRGAVFPFDRDGRAEIVYEMTAQGEADSIMYSFGLTGSCNPESDWSLIAVKPHITVRWSAEPIVQEQEPEEEQEKVQGEEPEQERENAQGEEPEEARENTQEEEPEQDTDTAAPDREKASDENSDPADDAVEESPTEESGGADEAVGEKDGGTAGGENGSIAETAQGESGGNGGTGTDGEDSSGTAAPEA